MSVLDFTNFTIPPDSLVGQICTFLQRRDVETYIVGGYVRDLLMGRASHDLDLAVPRDAQKWARRIANEFDGAYFPLDTERDTGRAIFKRDDEPFYVDVARLRGDSLEEDLTARDFTINAIAVALPDFRVHDPHDGQADIEAGTIRAVTDNSLLADSLRTLRAVRQAAKFNFKADEQTESLIRAAAPRLRSVSQERIRDEFAQIMLLDGAAKSLEYMRELGLLAMIVPELETLRGVEQSYPHYLDVYEHTLETLRATERIIAEIRGDLENGALLLASLQPFFSQMTAHLNECLSADRPRALLLKLGALLHDIGKPGVREVKDDGRVRFFNHDKPGAETTTEILQRLRFSNNEIQVVKRLVRLHMRPLYLVNAPRVSKRAIYRLFRAAETESVDVVLLGLADALATYEGGAAATQWEKNIKAATRLITTYYQKSRLTNPPKLINGRDLLEMWDIPPGPEIGKLLEAVREAQAVGEVEDREGALALVQRILEE